MKLTQLFADDDAVSPVIGVILMVAITVILAAVIGTFVMDLGQNTASQQATAGVSADGTTVTLTSLGANTQGIKCSNAPNNEVGPKNNGETDDDDGYEWTTNIGEELSCDGANAVVAYSLKSGVQNASIHTIN